VHNPQLGVSVFPACLPAGGRFRSKKNKENKAIGIIADIHIEKSIFPSFREAI
jgi:hypothetical protein